MRSIEQALPDWCEAADQSELLKILNETQKNDLKNWLARVKEIKDYQNQPQKVKEQVSHLLHWLAQRPSDDDWISAHTIISEAAATCGDRVALSLNDLYLMMSIDQQEELPLPELKASIIGCKRLELLDKIIQAKCRTLIACDPIEVQLCYHTQLKEALQLPIQTEGMLYERLAHVSQAEIEQAKTQILEETQQLSQQIEILSQHLKWKQKLENDSRFETFKTSCLKAKAEFLERVSGEEVEYRSEFETHDQTTWNPYYQLTQALLKSL
jgi:hypothetical protein